MYMNASHRCKNDILLKGAFEEAFMHLLAFFFNDHLHLFDDTKPVVFLDKELHEIFPETARKGGSRYVDVLARVYMKAGRTEYILVHIEIQGQNDKSFARRMFQYYYRIYDRFCAPLTAIAVFTGAKNQHRPRMFTESLLGTTVAYTYNSFHILDETPERLLAMNNPFALIMLAAQKALLAGKIPEEELGRERITIARALIESGLYSREKLRRFLYFLRNFIVIKNSELNDVFVKEVTAETYKLKKMPGLLDAIKIVERMDEREHTIAMVVKNLIVKSELSDKKVAEIAEVSISFVRKMRSQLQVKI